MNHRQEEDDPRSWLTNTLDAPLAWLFMSRGAPPNAVSLRVLHSRESRRVLSCVLSMAFAIAILYIRKPDSFRNPQLNAEDGTVFFAQEYNLGLRAHLQPSAGYLHEAPRLIASLSGLFPYRFAPALFNGFALLAILLLVAKLHSPRLDLPFAWAFALATVLVPQLTAEVFLSLTNVQWVLALVLLLVAVQEPPQTLEQAVSDWLIVFLAGLTGPFAPLVLPIFVVRAWRARFWYGAVTAGIVATTAAIQAATFLRNPVFVPTSPAFQSSSWLALLGQRLVGTLFLGINAPYRVPPLLLIAGGVSVLVFILWTVRANRPRLLFATTFLAFGGAVTGLSFLKFRAAADLLIPPGAAARYFFVANVVLAWSLLLAVATGTRFQRVVISVLLALVLASSLTSQFRTPPAPDFHWREYAERIGKEQPLSIPINPPGWSFVLSRARNEAARRGPSYRHK
jgi:hypothetical protein